MKKLISISLMVLITIMFSSIAVAKSKPNPPIVVNGTVINACYQKINGQLRVVSDPSMCRPSEIPITLSAPEHPKKVFITSLTYVGGAIGGIAGADADCSALATAAGLPGTYKAWISDDTIGPATTFTHSTVPYVNTHGDIIANDWIGLTSGVLLKPILYDESGLPASPPTAPILVWTGTDPLGDPALNQTCTGWTAAGVTGMEGLGMVTNSTWTLNPPPANCADSAHLYCFEQ